MKKYISLLFTGVMLLGSLSVPAYAAEQPAEAAGQKATAAAFCTDAPAAPAANAAAEEEVLLNEQNFPDPVFREYVSKKVDKDKNGVLGMTEYQNVFRLYVEKMGIHDLTGIAFFPQLEYLYCSGNQLTKLDVSSNSSLKELSCFNNQLTKLIIDNCKLLIEVNCSQNQLTCLSFRDLPNLRRIYCRDNLLTSLTANNLPVLDHLWCDNNQLTELDISSLPMLASLICSENKLTKLDANNCKFLKQLCCEKNQLSSLQINKCSHLTNLICRNNQLPQLTFTDHSSLQQLWCSSNKLTNLDVSALTQLSSLQCYSNNLTSLDVSNLLLLEELECSVNEIKELNISGLTMLETLVCLDNELTELNLSDCSSLRSLSCSSNPITSLDLSNCHLLNDLKAKNCYRKMFISTGSMDLHNLPGFDLSKASDWKNGSVDENWILTPYFLRKPVQYTYDCGQGKTATFSLYFENRPLSKFVDVPEDLYCHDAVNWAVSFGITKGVDETHFVPNQGCSRRHVAMFMWRALGKPEPASMENPFVDVKHDSFEKAILWMYYEGIATGKDATHFNPEDVCTRKQIATFLWRAEGKPARRGKYEFPDVKNDRFADPIYWAVGENIARGYTDKTFRPENTCTRGQIVTFLYRYITHN